MRKGRNIPDAGEGGWDGCPRDEEVGPQSPDFYGRRSKGVLSLGEVRVRVCGGERDEGWGREREHSSGDEK